MDMKKATARTSIKIRYAVIGQGYISQIAVLPAFEHASKNSELVALISDDPVKLKKLSQTYKVARTGTYDDYDALLASGEIDAVYIALPNNMHCDYTVRAARAGIHVLCEKPMAVTDAECKKMIETCDKHRVKLMIAYRLHFEKANLSAVDVVQSGKIGEPRLFNSLFTMQVRDEDNIRLQKQMGGGPLYDIGIYCLNAARYVFRTDPVEVFALTASNDQKRFGEVEEMASVVMRFPEERLATFSCSFGAADTSAYEVVGAKGHLRVDPAYEMAGDLKYTLTVKGRTSERTFPKRDQFAPELIYFSDCILKDRAPEPSGREGRIDVQIINALHKSAQTGRPVRIKALAQDARPSMKQALRRAAVEKPELVNAKKPSGD